MNALNGYDERIRRALRRAVVPPLSPDFAVRVLAALPVEHVGHMRALPRSGLSPWQLGTVAMLFWLGMLAGAALPSRAPLAPQNIFHDMVATDLVNS